MDMQSNQGQQGDTFTSRHPERNAIVILLLLTLASFLADLASGVPT